MQASAGVILVHTDAIACDNVATRGDTIAIAKKCRHELMTAF
jgi:hypothetical protein